MSSSYSASSVFHALPQRERKVKFDFEAANETQDPNFSSDEDLKLAIRLQKEENALAMEMEQRRVAAKWNSGRRRSGRSCAHGFGLKTVPPIPQVEISKETSPTKLAPALGETESEDSIDKDQTIQDNRSDSPTSSILRHSSPSKVASPFPEQLSPVSDEDVGDSNRPAWLKTQEMENSAKECWQETEKILKEDNEKVKGFRRRTGMGMFAPKWK